MTEAVRARGSSPVRQLRLVQVAVMLVLGLGLTACADRSPPARFPHPPPPELAEPIDGAAPIEDAPATSKTD